MATNNDLTQERIDGATPNGGTYAIAFYQDDSGQPTDKSKATKAEIIEFDNSNKQVWRNYMRLPRQV